MLGVTDKTVKTNFKCPFLVASMKKSTAKHAILNIDLYMPNVVLCLRPILVCIILKTICLCMNMRIPFPF